MTRSPLPALASPQFPAQKPLHFPARMFLIIPSRELPFISGMTWNLLSRYSHRPAISSSWMIHTRPAPRCMPATRPCALTLQPASPSPPSPPSKAHPPSARDVREVRSGRKNEPNCFRCGTKVFQWPQKQGKMTPPRDKGLAPVANMNEYAATAGQTFRRRRKNKAK